MHQRVVTGILLLIGATLAGCSNERPVFTPAPSGTLRIISSLPARGPAAGQSREISDAIRLSVADHKGESPGATIDYVPLDDSSDESGDWSHDKEMANATRAAEDPSVIAYIGPYNTGAAEISIPVTNRAGLLQASPSTTWPGLTQSGWDAGEPNRYFPTGNRTFFRLMPPDSVQAEAALQWAAQLDYGRVALVTDGSSYSEGMARTFRSAAPSLGITISASLNAYALGDANIGKALSGAQAIFYAPSSVENAVLIAGRIGPLGLPVLASDTALNPRFATEAGATGKNWLVVSNSAQPDGTGKFAPTLGSNSRERRFAGQFAASAYGMTALILDGVDSGAVHDRATLLAFIRSQKSSTGPLFSDAGDPNRWVASGYRVGPGGFSVDRTFSSSP